MPNEEATTRALGWGNGMRSSDLRLNLPDVHLVFLDGAYCERQHATFVWIGLGHLQAGEVGEVLEHALTRVEKKSETAPLLWRVPRRKLRDTAILKAREANSATGAASPLPSIRSVPGATSQCRAHGEGGQRGATNVRFASLS